MGVRACAARALRQTRILALPGAPYGLAVVQAPVRAEEAANVP